MGKFDCLRVPATIEGWRDDGREALSTYTLRETYLLDTVRVSGALLALATRGSRGISSLSFFDNDAV